MNTNLRDEPALVIALIQAAIALAVSFGLHLSPEQVGTMLALAAAISALVLRRHVSPVPSAGQPADPQLVDAQDADGQT